MINKVFYSVLIFISSFQLHAEFIDLTFGGGTMTEFVSRIQTDVSGGTNTFNFKPVFMSEAEYKLSDSFSLFPQLGATLPGSSDDSNIKRWNYFLVGHLGYMVGDWVLRLGSGFYMTYIWSSGGSQNLQNGTGTTDFPLPDGGSTSRNIITTLGADYYFDSDWTARVQTSVFNLLSEFNRAVSYSLTVHYHFGDSLWKK